VICGFAIRLGERHDLGSCSSACSTSLESTDTEMAMLLGFAADLLEVTAARLP